jgi:phage shock protein A
MQHGRLPATNVGMATSKKSTDKDGAITRLASRGEATLSRFTDLPGGTKALKAFNDLRERVDELGRKVRGIDKLEARVAKLEKELAALKRAQKPKSTTARTTTRKTTARSSTRKGTEPKS